MCTDLCRAGTIFGFREMSSFQGCYFLQLITDQRNMGMSMKVEKSTVDQVKQRFEFNKKKKEEEKKQYGETY